MARIPQKTMMSILSAIITDNYVIKHDKSGRIMLARRPVFVEDREFSEAQKEQQGRFREASLYAKSAIGKEAIYAEMAAGTARTAYNVAIADWFCPPEIEMLDLSEWTGQAGELIRIMAVDDVQVKRVTVLISDELGALIEQGAAVQEGELWWVYTTRQAAAGEPQVTVTAEDLPGNVTQEVAQLVAPSAAQDAAQDAQAKAAA